MRVAFYESDITPPLGGFISGHYANVRGNDVVDKLYAKAVVIEDGDNIAALMVMDTVHIPGDARDAITKRVYEYTGIRPENVCICSNHTHAGAPVLSNPELECYEDATYKDVFLRLCADAIILAYKRLDDATAKFGSCNVEGIAFNRTFVLEDGTFVTHGRGRKNIKESLGGIDTELGVLVFERDGKPIGAVTNYACHQCCMGAIKGYSGDYSSIMSKKLKEYYGQDFVNVFVIGCAGDVNHHNPDINVPVPNDIYITMGLKLAEGAKTSIDNATDSNGKVGMITAPIEFNLRQADYDYTKARVLHYLNTDDHFMRVRNLLHYNSNNHNKTQTVFVQGISVGDTCIYALPGEVFVEIGLEIKEKSPFKNNLIAENSNTRSGYVCPERVFGDNDNLYETALCFGSCYAPDSCEKLISKSIEVAKLLKEV